LNYREPDVPRTLNGKVNLTPPRPKDPFGKPDLSSVWMHETTTAAEMRRLYGSVIDEAIEVDAPGMEVGPQHRYSRNILIDFKTRRSPGASRNPRTNARPVRASPSRCLHTRLQFWVSARRPALSDQDRPGSKSNIALYEAGNFHRQIYTDGRKLPQEVNLPAFHGYSAAHWEGDTLVVETAGFNDKTPLDAMGHPHSEALLTLERFRRRDFGHLD
jgi:hypothetical protein